MKILILYAKYGGGHQFAAKALAESFTRQYGDDVEVILADGTGNAGFKKSLSEAVYSIFTNRFNYLWAFFYWLNKFLPILLITHFFGQILMIPELKRLINEHKPDKIVNTYFFGHFLNSILKFEDYKPGVFTVITDPFVFHPVWTLNQNQKFIVYSKEAKNLAVTYGVKEEKLHTFGPIIAKKFDQAMNKQEIAEFREKMRIGSGKTILIIGGGEGLNHGFTILKTIAQENIEGNIVLVCGKNENLKRRAEELKSSLKRDSIYIYGFSTEVYELMNLADVIVTKAGPGIIFEAAKLEKPILINSYLWEQELGNKDFVVHSKIGLYEPNIQSLSKKVHILLSSENEITQIKENYENLELENGVDKIVEFVYNN